MTGKAAGMTGKAAGLTAAIKTVGPKTAATAVGTKTATKTAGTGAAAKAVSASTATAVAAAGAAVYLRARKAARAEGTQEGPWHVVTVGRPRAELMPDGKLPPPLDGLGDGVEIRAADAPGGRGTEIAARRTAPRGTAEGLRSMAGSSTDQQIREALREFKQLTETGEVLRTEGQPAGRRKPGGMPLGLAARRARKEGLL
ncbi:hypothetical protein [Streptomyces sp. SYP-A7185]|uniref:hypothetical protein n=1 Tax=Streptomyces sp. SYP-A7185 TaxID=3040076 RepID=UPI0038F6C888